MSLTLEEIKEFHDRGYEHGYDTRQKAAEDVVFAWVTQWDDTFLNESDLGYRGEFNILRKAIRQILTDLVLNPVQVDFEPVDETDDSGADIMDGIYRSDMRNNRALEAKDNATQEAVVCGFGAWEMRAEYKTNNSTDDRQVVRRQPIYEANNCVFWDDNAKLLDKSDADWVSVLVPYSEKGYLKLKKRLTGEDDEHINDSSFAHPEISYAFPWITTEKQVHVVRFFHRELTEINFLTFEDMFGTKRTIREDDFDRYEEEFVDKGFNKTGERKVERYEVTRYIASGEDILEKTVIAGEHIPVIPQYGERAFVESQEHYEGVVRLAKDPQRLRNFQLSYLADIVSRSPREKPIFTAEQIQGFEDMYEENGIDNNLPYQLQNAFAADGTPLPVGPVGYTKAPELPAALIASIGESRAAVDDVASAGLPKDIEDSDISGKAVSKLQKRIDMQSHTYQDHHKFAIRREGEVYASMVRDIYDDEQEVTLVKVDGSKGKETINKATYNFEAGASEIENDMSSMQFDVYAEVGPSFESVKAENKEELKELINGMDPNNPVYTMLLNEYLMLVDGVSFKDVREYARKELITMGVKKPETDEEKQMVQQQQQQKDQQEQQDPMVIAAQAEAQKAQADLVDAETRKAEAQTKQFEAETKRHQMMINAKEAGVNIENKMADTQGKQLDNQGKVPRNRAGQMQGMSDQELMSIAMGR